MLTDGKIPCNSDNDPLFSYAVDKKSSWISLIEKAYAKVKGGYKNIYSGETNQYLFELCRKIPLENSMNLDFKKE